MPSTAHPAPKNLAPRALAIQRLRQLIDSGALSRGTPLPTERDLAKQLGLNRSAVQRALAVLENEGVILNHDGRTRTVGHGAANTSSGLLHASIALLGGYQRPKDRHTRSGWVEFVSLGAIDAIRAAGLHALWFDPGRLEGGDFERLMLERPLGCVIPEVTNQPIPPLQMLKRLAEAGIPVAVYGNAPEFSKFDRVTSDHAHGAYELTKGLLERGCRRVAIMLPVEPAYWISARRDGYERAMREAGLEPRSPINWIDMKPLGGSAREQVVAATQYMYGCLHPHLISEQPVDGLLMVSDGSVCTVSAACRALGKVPNRDVMLAGYDNYWPDAWEQEYEPSRPVLTADKLNSKMGSELVQLVLDRTAGRLPNEPQCKVIQPRIVVVDEASPTITEET